VPLHASKHALNLSIENLGPDFKREQILDRLKLLDAKTSVEDGVGHDDDDDDDGDEDDADSDDLGSCSTCDGSADFLSCSKPENQRKSIRIWRQKDSEERSKAYEMIAGLKATPRNSINTGSHAFGHQTSSQNNLHTGKNVLDLSLKNLAVDFNKEMEKLRLLEEEGVRSLSLTHIKEKELKTSNNSINLKLQGLDFKNEKILEKLKLLNAKRKTQDSIKAISKSDLSVGEESDETSDGDQVRDCDSCKNSIDLLFCSNAQNKRNTLRRWRTRGKSEIEQAVETVISRRTSLIQPKKTV